MNLLEIIHKKETRTEAELKFAFNILFYADKTITNNVEYGEFDINELLDKLDMISKTRLLIMEYCPFQFKCHYILGLNTPPTRIMIDGCNLHLVNEQYWNSITENDYEKFSNLAMLKENIIERYRSFIPHGEMTKFVEKMIKKFAHFEFKRIVDIFNKKGKNIDIFKKYVIPVFAELSIENWNNNLMGIIDRADLLTNDVYCAIEYKYGKPKYFTKDYWKKAIKRELGFYALLMQGNNVRVIDEYNNAISIKEILGFKPMFYYGSMLFFQDIDNTGELFVITKSILNSTQKAIDKYWKIIETGQFRPIPRPSACIKYCGFYHNLCELNDEWSVYD